MKRPSDRSEGDADHTLGGRLIAAIVAVLFFAPLLALIWFGGNELVARTGSHALVPLHWLKLALGAVAVLGFLLPRLVPTLFGWLAQGFLGIGRVLFFGGSR